MEGDESPRDDLPQARTPVAKATTQKTPSKTPTSVNAVRPPPEEMHPSKAQHSTTRQADSGLILGFNPIKKDADGNAVNDSTVDNTPSKSKTSPAPTFETPGFEFKFASQESQLSDEARRLMDSVREDVMRIKTQMVLDKSKQEREDQEAEQQLHGERKIAKPKGKAGRFSDVHMAEFKKMDSIAGHASSFRATPGRCQPMAQSLKRTKSKAQLDEPESQTSSPMKHSGAPTPAAAAKRVKHNQTDDTSTGRSATGKNETPRKPAGPRARPTVRSSLMTPTRASVARSTSTSIKAPKTSMIPSLKRSPAAKVVASPRTPRTDFNPRLKSNMPTLGNLRSILRRHQPLFSRDPAKIAAGTHVAAPDFNPDTLLSRSTDPVESATTPSPKKHVEFTPSVKSRHDLAQASPSPSKIPSAPRPSGSASQATTSGVVYPTLPALYPVLPALTPEKNSAPATTKPLPAKSPTIRQVRDSEARPSYPEIPVVAHGIAHGIGNKKRRREDVDDDETENVPPAEAQSDERSTKRLKSNPPTPTPVKARPVKTPVHSTPGRMATPSSKSRGVLSLSRLNMLAKPKGRV